MSEALRPDCKRQLLPGQVQTHAAGWLYQYADVGTTAFSVMCFVALSMQGHSTEAQASKDAYSFSVCM